MGNHESGVGPFIVLGVFISENHRLFAFVRSRIEPLLCKASLSDLCQKPPVGSTTRHMSLHSSIRQVCYVMEYNGIYRGQTNVFARPLERDR